jgi:hypothetical protein
MRRREFITLLGAAAGLPLAAQQPMRSDIPLHGWELCYVSSGDMGPYRRAKDLSRFEEGLRQAGLPE